MSTNVKHRIFGLFFGDALGTRYEFMSSKNAITLINKDMNNKYLEILDGGPFDVKKGQYTDDSELALGLWYSILKHKLYDIKDICNIFLKWYGSNPFDIGRATNLAFGTSNTMYEIKKNARKFNMLSLSNGCLMKISALGCINVLLNKSYDLEFLANEICYISELI
jgi:ADP-ribosyl-[dinitrogen reductase] hydrolase